MDQTEKLIVPAAILGILGMGIFLQSETGTAKALLFLIGAGLGIALYHAAFGFTGGWRRFIREGHTGGVSAQILLLALTSVVFFPLIGGLLAETRFSGAYGPVGVSVMAGAFLFGIGMQLGGGCGSGTLFTVGGGSVRMMFTLAFFIVGATLGSVHLDWWLALPALGRVSLIEELGWAPSLLLQGVALAGLYLLVRAIARRRGAQPPAAKDEALPFADRLLFGPWPLWWGAAILAAFSVLTLLIAGHPWSITFAFGLWGAKTWAALGGDLASVPYWASGYPARALGQSVLADTTSVMNFGIILGALLAAALRGKFAPAVTLKASDLATAVIGGLLLGYGARLAFGCNIGALLGGISSGSLHGWLWLVFAFAGNMIGVRLRVLAGLDRPFGTAT